MDGLEKIRYYPVIMKRSDAKAAGLKTYRTGKPCANGHNAPRFTTSGACSACNKRHKERWNDKNAPDVKRKRQLRDNAAALDWFNWNDPKGRFYLGRDMILMDIRIIKTGDLEHYAVLIEHINGPADYLEAAGRIFNVRHVDGETIETYRQRVIIASTSLLRE